MQTNAVEVYITTEELLRVVKLQHRSKRQELDKFHRKLADQVLNSKDVDAPIILSLCGYVLMRLNQAFQEDIYYIPKTPDSTGKPDKVSQDVIRYHCERVAGFAVLSTVYWLTGSAICGVLPDTGMVTTEANILCDSYIGNEENIRAISIDSSITAWELVKDHGVTIEELYGRL